MPCHTPHSVNPLRGDTYRDTPVCVPTPEAFHQPTPSVDYSICPQAHTSEFRADHMHLCAGGPAWPASTPARDVGPPFRKPLPSKHLRFVEPFYCPESTLLRHLSLCQIKTCRFCTPQTSDKSAIFPRYFWIQALAFRAFEGVLRGLQPGIRLADTRQRW